jgi:hypothetical protein
MSKPSFSRVTKGTITLALTTTLVLAACSQGIEPFGNRDYEQAQAKAREWRPDAYAVSYSFMWRSLKGKEVVGKIPDELSIGFASPSTNQHLVYTINKQRQVIGFSPDKLPPDVPIETLIEVSLSEWRIDYNQALKIIEAEGGAEFRLAREGVIVDIEYGYAVAGPFKGKKVILGTYFLPGASDELAFYLDPTDGTILHKQRLGP